MRHRTHEAPDGFEEYVRVRYGDLPRLAFLLCDDWSATDDLLVTRSPRAVPSPVAAYEIAGAIRAARRRR